MCQAESDLPVLRVQGSGFGGGIRDQGRRDRAWQQGLEIPIRLRLMGTCAGIPAPVGTCAGIPAPEGTCGYYSRRAPSANGCSGLHGRGSYSSGTALAVAVAPWAAPLCAPGLSHPPPSSLGGRVAPPALSCVCAVCDVTGFQ